MISICVYCQQPYKKINPTDDLLHLYRDCPWEKKRNCLQSIWAYIDLGKELKMEVEKKCMEHLLLSNDEKQKLYKDYNFALTPSQFHKKREKEKKDEKKKNKII
jgi:hypothetical protein